MGVSVEEKLNLLKTDQFRASSPMANLHQSRQKQRRQDKREYEQADPTALMRPY